MTRVNLYLVMWGLLLSAQGYLCALISDTPFHTSRFYNSQWGAEGQLYLLNVNMTHLVAGKFGWYFTTAQYLNADCD